FLLGIMYCLYMRDKQQTLGFLIGSSIVISVFMFQYLYYDSLFPNTYYLKSEGTNGLEYINTFLFKEFFHFPIMLGAGIYLLLTRPGRVNKEELKFAVFIIGWLVYILYIGEDAFSYGRFFIPIIPLLCILCGRCIKRFYENNFYLILIIILFGLHVYFRFAMPINEDIPKETVDVITTVKQFPTNNTIAIYYAGRIPYFLPEYKFHDLLGKNDRHIAMTKKKQGKVGHNKWDYDYSLDSLKPDVIITATHFYKYSDNVAKLQIMNNYNYSFHSALYLDSTFKTKYKYYSGYQKLIYKKQ